MTKPTPAQLMRKVERLQRENEELRDKIAHHMLRVVNHGFLAKKPPTVQQ